MGPRVASPGGGAAAQPGDGAGHHDRASPRAAGTSWVAQVWNVEWNSANETPSRALAASTVHVVWASRPSMEHRLILTWRDGLLPPPAPSSRRG